MTIMKTITYVFIGGRKENFFNNTIEAKEFYYGLPYFAEKGHKVNVIEFNENLNFLNSFFKIYDKILNKFLSIPSYTHKLNTIKNYKILRKSDNVILVSESTGFSSLMTLILLKYTKTRVSLFVMGLYSKKVRYPSLKFLHNFYIKLLVFFIDDVLILGKGEYNKALGFHRNIEKLTYFPFCIDTKFWANKENIDISSNNKILFIGNDGNRDFQLVSEITKELSEITFRLISENHILTSNKLENTIIHEGKWGTNLYTDEDLKQFYLDCKFVIIPLKKSTQPSGQSVALQAMSLGIPVMISKTEGFWDEDFYEHNFNIIFVEQSNKDNWTHLIQVLYNERQLLKNVGRNACKTVQSRFSLENFNKNLSDILKI